MARQAQLPPACRLHRRGQYSGCTGCRSPRTCGGCRPRSLGTRLNRVPPDGILRTFAGTGNRCNQSTDPFCGDGRPAATAPVEPWGMAFGPDGTLYVAELNRSVIRAIATDGTISTVA